MVTKQPKAETDVRCRGSESLYAMPNPIRLPASGKRFGLEPLEPRLLLSGSISAQFVQVDNSAALSGYNTYDLEVTTDSDWSFASLLIELSGGSIYQDSAGGDRAPNPTLFSEFPTVEFDTYVAANGHSLSILGNAAEIGGDSLQFDSQEIDITWFDLNKSDTGTVVIGRFTLSDDAVGGLGLKVLDTGSGEFATWDTFTSGDLVNLTPAPPRTPTPPPKAPPPLPLDFSARFVEVDNSSALTGYTTFDLEVTTGTDWIASALLLELTQGSIYQDVMGTHIPQSPFFFDQFPTLEFDSYVAANGHSTSIAGHAGDLGGRALQFDSNRIDITWFDIDQDDIGTIIIGRFTLSDDAAGDIKMLNTNGNGSGHTIFASDSFTNGGLGHVTPTAPRPPGSPPPPAPPTPPPPVKAKPILARFVEVDNSSALAGFKTYDLQITTNTDWSTASLLIDLEQGSIYQDAAGTDLAPNPVTFSAFSALEFDTYITANGKMTSIAGDADGDGEGESRFDTTRIDISWSGLATDDTGTLTIGRVTLSEDAVGSMQLVVEGDRNELTNSGTFLVGDLANTKSTATPASASAAAADFTGDGRADIFWRNTLTGNNSIWEMNGSGFMGSIDLQLQGNPNWQAVGAADLTGDGKADILWRNKRNGRNLVTEMDGTAIKDNIAIKRLRNRAWIVSGISDFTGDGKADILWRHTRNGRNSVWEMDGTDFRDGVSLKTVRSQDWSIAGTTDFTGDGKADILWRNTRNGRNSVWEMDRTDFVSNNAIRKVKSQDMQVAAVGDYTGDGLADILWRDAKRGRNFVWQMDGTDFNFNLAIKSQPGSDWQPAGTLLGLWE